MEGELMNVYFCVCSDTSRKPKKGDRESRMYAFTSRSKMETDIKNGRYLEHGEYDGNLYGIKIDSIHEVVEAGRICILDANPRVRTRGYFASTSLQLLTYQHKLIKQFLHPVVA